MKKVRSKFQAFFEVEKRSEKRPHFFKDTLHSLGYEYPERRNSYLDTSIPFLRYGDECAGLCESVETQRL